MSSLASKISTSRILIMMRCVSLSFAWPLSNPKEGVCRRVRAAAVAQSHTTTRPNPHPSAMHVSDMPGNRQVGTASWGYPRPTVRVARCCWCRGGVRHVAYKTRRYWASACATSLPFCLVVPWDPRRSATCVLATCLPDPAQRRDAAEICCDAEPSRS
jgi:hypothetical protein